MELAVGADGAVSMKSNTFGVDIDSANIALKGLVIDLSPVVIKASIQGDSITYAGTVKTPGSIYVGVELKGSINLTNFIRNEFKFMDAYIERMDYYRAICNSHPESLGSCSG